MRNLITRSISGVIFIAIMVAALLLGSAAYCVVFGIVLVIMMVEYYKIMTPHGKLEWQKISTIATALLLFVDVLLIGGGVLSVRYLLIPVGMILFIYAGNLYTKSFNRHNISDGGEREANGYEQVPTVMNALIYIALPVSLFSLAAFFPDNSKFRGEILLGFFIMLWASDVGAYCFGCTLGRRGPRLFPSVSPKKSWIGSIGGVLCALAAAAIINSFTDFLPFSLVDSIIVAALISIGGGFGDLVESQLKRNFGIKDSGSIMPGHGGMLDRFDGALLGFPPAVIYLELFLK